MPGLTRRALIAGAPFVPIAVAAPTAAAAVAAARSSSAAPTAPLLAKPLPKTGEPLPVVGLGSWITFNVGTDAAARAGCAAVLKAFFEGGGRVVDSSPMYGSSQAVIGEALARIAAANGGRQPPVYAADKVWISPGARGPTQIEQSRAAWRIGRFDLLQVHNLLAWEEHLPQLLAMKSDGRVRHVGITTSEGRRHREIERLLDREPGIDVVQVSYNIVDRDVEQRILPLAAERKVGVLANRPFRQGDLLRELQQRPLPGWAAELGCTSWAEAILKFIVSHPAVTCAIPATTRVDHVRQNLRAARPPWPDETLRRRMAADVARLV